MPSLFVLGDSISMQYGPFLAAMTAHAMSYARKTETQTAGENLDEPALKTANGGDSSMCFAYLRERAQKPDFKPDWLLLNCGLHDIKRCGPAGTTQVAIGDYRRNLEAMVALIGSIGVRLVWVRTTPIDDATHAKFQQSFSRCDADVMAYNATADDVMNRAHARIIDLYTFTKAYCPACFKDHAHFTEEMQVRQAAFIAGHLIAWQQSER